MAAIPSRSTFLPASPPATPLPHETLAGNKELLFLSSTTTLLAITAVGPLTRNQLLWVGMWNILDWLKPESQSTPLKWQ